MRHWYETAAPFERIGKVRQPSLPDAPARTDVYLVLPAADGMGIKWREGEFQIKGRVASAGIQVFGGRHQGAVEGWVKWSYRNVPAAYRRLFDATSGNGLITVPVVKRRVLRRVRLDPLTGGAHEVEASAQVDRGAAFELTDLEARGRSYCSVAFEAFPDDAGMDAAFTAAVETFLAPLADLTLAAATSMSYPTWLQRITA
ncbi:MAG: hypothetical protein ABJC89_09610 [Acidobacteriota bacterium]